MGYVSFREGNSTISDEMDNLKFQLVFFNLLNMQVIPQSPVRLAIGWNNFFVNEKSLEASFEENDHTDTQTLNGYIYIYYI